MARVLVTGASGFIGSHLVKALMSRGDDVGCLVRAHSNVDRLLKLGARLVIGDVCDRESLPGPIAEVDVVYHVAGLTKANSYADYCRVNEGGVEHVVEVCARRTSPPVVVVASSLSAAGAMEENRLRVESDPAQPASNYGMSKRAGELAAEAKAGEVPIVVIRPPIVMGPGDTQTLALFRSIKRAGVHFALGLGKRVSIVYVADLAAAMIAASQHGERLPADKNAAPPGQGYYFVAGDENPVYADLGPIVGRAIGRDSVRVMRMPTFMLWLSAIGGSATGRLTGKPRYMDLDRAKEVLAGHWICSREKATRDLGFVPSAPLEAQLRETAEWYEREGWM